MGKDFTHIHIHTEYSLSDGINKIDKLCEHVKNSGMSACAITDHGAMGGIIEFYKTAEKIGIKPILGVEAYTTFDEDDLENKDKTRDNMHCVILAQDDEGLSNLISLTNKAYLNNFYYKPRISIQNLHGNTNGIIATSGCLGGIVRKVGTFDEGNKTFEDTTGACQTQLELFSTLFGGRFYAEIQDLPIWKQQAYNTWLIKKARDMNIPLVITADAHFLTEDDYETHRLIVAKNMGKILTDDKEDNDDLIYHREHHVRIPEDMYKSACKLDAEEAFWNTTEIAKQCDLKIKLGEYKYPYFDITQENDYEDFLLWEKKRFEYESSKVN
jgi:DNA polymerase-3 subunit alpha